MTRSLAGARLLLPPALMLSLLALACAPGHRLAAPAEGETAVLELHATTDGVAPGGETTLLVRFAIAPEWHLYWKNPGDSGLAPELVWSLPEGWSAGEPTWPAPAVLESASGDSFVYETELWLAVPLRAPVDAPLGAEAAVFLHASWLACRESCVAGEGRASLRLAVEADPSPLSREGRWLSEIRAGWPAPAPPGDWTARLDGARLELACVTGSAELPARARLLCEDGGWLDDAAGQWNLAAGGARWSQPLLAWGDAPPDTLRGLLLDLDRPSRAWRLELAVEREPAPRIETQPLLERSPR